MKALSGKTIINHIIFGIVFLAILGGAMYIQHRHLTKIKPSRPYRDSLYLPRGEYVKFLSLGYDMVVADILWLRAIQAFGGHYLGDRNYEGIINLFDVITDLNPYFIDAYLFGNTVIGEEAGQKEKGLVLINKGISKTLRRSYRLGYWGGYDATWNIRNYKLAKYYFRMALKCPDCPDYVERLLTFTDEKMGNYHVAFQKRVEDYLRAIDNNDSLLEDISRKKIIDVIQQWHIAIMKQSAKQYHEKFGKDISNLEQLINEGLIGEYTVPVYALLEERIRDYREQQQKLLPYFQDIVDHTMRSFNNQIPPEPAGTWYFVVYGQALKDEDFIFSGNEARELTKTYLQTARALIQKFKDDNGRFPFSFIELFPKAEEEPLDLFGKKWDYNPLNGEIKSSVFPDL